MLENRTLLEEALEAWRGARLGFIDEVRNIPASRWDYRPDSAVKSVRELAVHVLEVAMMMVGELTRADTDFHRMEWPRLLRRYARRAYNAKTRGELLSLLRSQLGEGTRRFEAAGELHMLQMIERFDGRPGTRLAWLFHATEQEMYHRGQITVYARLLGREPVLTQRIRGG